MVTFTSDNLVCERFILGPLEVNTYIVYEKGARECLLIDPAEESQTVAKRLKELDFSEITIFLTHGHADHICGVEFFRREFPFCKVAIAAEDAAMLTDAALNLSVYLGEPVSASPADIILRSGNHLKTGSTDGILASIPGHTPGGMILIFPGMIFSGDTLFAGSVGRSDFPGGNGKELISSIKKHIFSLSDRQVFPGHGPETTIRAEMSDNPFFGTFFNI
ncbi:MAG: MBL fold metallo-hydrolase [Candidatus Riflebacteria bacterium]|nr:MBL fold metallo-hydrolase [Candidatus Riflebacteria bacterium]